MVTKTKTPIAAVLGIKSKGQTESYSFLIGLLLTIIILGAIGIGVYQSYIKEDATEKCFKEITDKIRELNPGGSSTVLCQLDEDYFLTSFNNDQEILSAVRSSSDKCDFANLYQQRIYKKPAACQGFGCLCLCNKEGPGGEDKEACVIKSSVCEKFSNLEFIGECFFDDRFFAAGDRVYNLKVEKSEDGQFIGICTLEEGKDCLYPGIKKAKEMLNRLAAAYENCNSFDNGCVCGEVSLEELPEDYYVIAVKNGDQIDFRLFYNKYSQKAVMIAPTAENAIATASLKGQPALYSYPNFERGLSFSRAYKPSAHEKKLERLSVFDVNEAATNKSVYLTKIKTGGFDGVAFTKATDFGWDVFGLEEGFCEPKEKVAFIEIAPYDAAGFSKNLFTNFLAKIKLVSPFLKYSYQGTELSFQLQQETIRGPLFDFLYQKIGKIEEGKPYLKDNLFFMLFMINTKPAEEIGYSFNVIYLENSKKSKGLAEGISSTLSTLKDKSERFSKMQVNLKPVGEENDKIFQSCSPKYPSLDYKIPICHEKNEIPAVVVEIIISYRKGLLGSVDEKKLGNDYALISEKVYEAVRDYFGFKEPMSQQEPAKSELQEETQFAGGGLSNMAEDCKIIPEGEAMPIQVSQPCISVDLIGEILEKANSPVADKSQAFFDMGVKYGIDPAIALAFFRKESYFGALGRCNIPSISKNPGNLKYSKQRCTETYYNKGDPCPEEFWAELEERPYCKFGSWEGGIEAWYKAIVATPYIASGKTTVESLFPTYAPDLEYPKQVKSWVNEWRQEEINRRSSGKVEELQE